MQKNQKTDHSSLWDKKNYQEEFKNGNYLKSLAIIEDIISSKKLDSSERELYQLKLFKVSILIHINNLKEARSTLLECFVFYKKDNNLNSLAICSLYEGIIEYLTSNYEVSKRKILESYKYFLENNKLSYTATALFYLGCIESEQSQYDKASVRFEESKRYYEKSDRMEEKNLSVIKLCEIYIARSELNKSERILIGLLENKDLENKSFLSLIFLTA